MQIPCGKLPCPSILTPRASGNQLTDRFLEGRGLGMEVASLTIKERPKSCMTRLKKWMDLGTGDQTVNAVVETNEARFCVQTSSIPWRLLLQKNIMDGAWYFFMARHVHVTEENLGMIANRRLVQLGVDIHYEFPE